VVERFNDITSFLFGVGANQTFIVHSAGIGSVHNSYVNFFGNYGFIALLALLGFIALLALLGFIIFILYTAFNQNKMLFIVLLSIFIQALFETVLFIGFHITWVTAVLLYAGRNRIKERVNPHTNHSI